MKHSFATPYAELLPPLSTAEMEALRQRIKDEGGIHDPVLLTEDGEVLDGHNRLRIDPSARTKKIPGSKGWSAAQRQAFVIRCNRGRRNLSPDQSRAIDNRSKSLAFELKLEGKTQAAIAEIFGVTREAVKHWIDKDITNGRASNGNTPIDCRVKVPTPAKVEIARRVEAGEKQEQVAAEFKISQPTVSKIVTTERKKADADKRREERTAEIPTGLFDVLLADPPWRYDFSETDERKIEGKYPTMDVLDICKLKVPSAKDAVLFLWATAPKLREAFEVLDAWGFSYKTHAVWDKEKLGMGYWFRGQHELLLVGTKGDFAPPSEKRRESSVIRAPRKGHSAKPAEVYELIERMFPTARRLELFARTKRDGWTPWGNEAPE